MKPKLLPKRPRVRTLSHQQWVWLAFGPIEGEPDPFATDEDELAAWQVHRARMLGSINAGFRPAAWWRFESPEPRDRTVEQAEQLGRMGALTHDEVLAMQLEGRVIELEPFRKTEKEDDR
jgi:hypothetical protein